jgi:hypothetical protein
MATGTQTNEKPTIIVDTQSAGLFTELGEAETQTNEAFKRICKFVKQRKTPWQMLRQAWIHHYGEDNLAQLSLLGASFGNFSGFATPGSRINKGRWFRKRV